MDRSKFVQVFIISLICQSSSCQKKSEKDIFHECLKQSIERAEENANVIFTGTIRDVYKDWEHPKMLKANVEVKRVMKGSKVINTIPAVANSDNSPWGRKTVVVDGLGDPGICDSSPRKYDTRIFLLVKGQNGELKLNSSLIRLTLNNIIRADAAVQDKPFTPRPMPPIGKSNPCEATFCAFGAKCFVDDITGLGSCRCIKNCDNSIFAPVCGTDSVTYTNECNLRMASCKKMKYIAVARQGSCGVKDPCEEKICDFGAQCIVSMDGTTAKCQCPTVCEDYGDHDWSMPVCGSDGRDYDTLCHMNKQACQNMQNITLKYKGRCDPCDDHRCPPAQVCQIDEDRAPVCRCYTDCILSVDQVCGNDGKTYSNECELRSEACQRVDGRDLYMLYQGSCDAAEHPCESVNCASSEECLVDRGGHALCTCPSKCPKLYRPVCGSDGKTYGNECEMERASCRAKRDVHVKFYGECSLRGPCNNYECDHGAICVVDGYRATCRCAPCSNEYEPVCGTDNISHDNECKMRQEACEERTDIAVQYEGLCRLNEPKLSDPEWLLGQYRRYEYYSCKDVVCKNYGVCDAGQCKCATGCIQVYAPVCGSDGQTYSNECKMQVTSCETKTWIQVTSQGPCDQCANVNCKFGSVCTAGKCMCPNTACPAQYDPVCASNGVTYSNPCEMRAAGCNRSMDLDIVSRGPCEEEEETSGSGGGMCDDLTCQYGGLCEYDTEGSFGCQCNMKCDAVRSEVCGSDGVVYGSICQMRVESCRQQAPIMPVDMDNCGDFDAGLCDGNAPLVDMQTGLEYDCSAGGDSCPPNSYCHGVGPIFRCCEGNEDTVDTCADTLFGCCPDGKTVAPGRNGAGCPSMCGCHPLGSTVLTCDPSTNQCSCKAGVGGLRCDRCEPGYWGLPKIADGNNGCIPCGCNIYGSVREDCEQMTGRCSCQRPGMGQKCDKCPDGREITASGCTGVPGARSCDEVLCQYGAECRITNGFASCECPRQCFGSTSDEQVCGSDRMTYASECQLNMLACRQQRALRVLYEGPCSGTSPVDNKPNRPRKTTRHIPDPTRPPVYGVVGDPCIDDRDCYPENSECKQDTCMCTENHTPNRSGTRCEADPCLENPCQQGGFCIPDLVQDFKCICPLGIGGKLCEEGPSPLTTNAPKDLNLTTALDTMYFNDFGDDMNYVEPAFSGQSYLRLKKLHHANRELTIEMTFKSYNLEGILLFSSQNANGTGDFVSLAIRDGYVEFRYNLGSKPAILRSADRIVRNTYHTVVAKRFNADGTLTLDNGPTVNGQSPGTLTSLNLNTDLFLGYVPDITADMTAVMQTGRGLVGCIESLKIHGTKYDHEYDLFYPQSLDILGGMGIRECGENACSAMPCGSGGICVNLNSADLYECQCYPGYSGKHCSMLSSSNPCERQPCEAGGICSPLNDNQFYCDCKPGRHGETCEQYVVQEITVPEFHGNSYMQIPLTRHIGRTFEFELWFRPTQPNGVLMYIAESDQPKGDYVRLELVDGSVIFMFDLGGGPAAMMSPGKIKMDTWIKVVVNRTNRHGTMKVDDQAQVESEAQGNLNELNVDPVLYLGGYPRLYETESADSTGFTGAIQRLYDNGIKKDSLMGSASEHAHISHYAGPPCGSGAMDNPCLHDGVCVPVLDDYQCRCSREYGGKKCETPLKLVDPNLPIRFDGRTTHRYPNKITKKQRSEVTNDISLRLRTDASEGLILLMHKAATIKGDYLAIALVDGAVQVSYNLGKQSADNLFILTSNTRINDGQWHTVHFIRNHRLGRLVIDSEAPVEDTSLDGASQLDTDGNLYIGGGNIEAPRGLPGPYNTGLDGCIDSVLIDGLRLDMAIHRLSTSQLQFCGL